MGQHGKTRGALLRQAQEEQEARRKEWLRRRNRLVHGLMVVPFGLALATMLVLAFGAAIAEPFFVAMLAMLIFALAGGVLMVMALDEATDWWGAVMPCCNQRGWECTLSDTVNALVVPMLALATLAIIMAMIAGWGTVLVTLGPVGFVATMVTFVMMAFFCMVSDSDLEQAKRIYAETEDCVAVLRGMLRRKKED